MKYPKLKTTYVRLDYWDCGINGHHHKAEDVANRCLSRQSRGTLKSKKDVWRNRRIVITDSVMSGTSYRVVGERFGVSGGQTRSLFITTLQESIRHLCKAGADNGEYWELRKQIHSVKEVRENSKEWAPLIRKLAKAWGIE
jgi:hypothetical protein